MFELLKFLDNLKNQLIILKASKSHNTITPNVEHAKICFNSSVFNFPPNIRFISSTFSIFIFPNFRAKKTTSYFNFSYFILSICQVSALIHVYVQVHFHLWGSVLFPMRETLKHAEAPSRLHLRVVYVFHCFASSNFSGTVVTLVRLCGPQQHIKYAKYTNYTKTRFIYKSKN